MQLKRILLIATAALTFGLASGHAAKADWDNHGYYGGGYGGGGWHDPNWHGGYGGGYYPPRAPVYYAPPRVYCPPPPRYYAPPPRFYAPPVYYAPPVFTFGFGFGR